MTEVDEKAPLVVIVGIHNFSGVSDAPQLLESLPIKLYALFSLGRRMSTLWNCLNNFMTRLKIPISRAFSYKEITPESWWEKEFLEMTEP